MLRDFRVFPGLPAGGIELPGASGRLAGEAAGDSAAGGDHHYAGVWVGVGVDL